jgi:hypothetical protein
MVELITFSFGQSKSKSPEKIPLNRKRNCSTKLDINVSPIDPRMIKYIDTFNVI